MQEKLGIQMADCSGIGKGKYLSAQPQRQGCDAVVATSQGAGTIMVKEMDMIFLWQISGCRGDYRP